MRYFFKAYFCDPSSDYFLLAARCHRVLHGFQCRHDLRIIGVTYPQWSEYSVGKCIGFICQDERILNQFSTQPFFHRMHQINKLNYSSVQKVQDGFPEGQFIRIQNPDKFSIVWIERENRRRAKRGLEPFQSVPRSRSIPHHHSLDVNIFQGKLSAGSGYRPDISIGKRKRFNLHIHRECISSQQSGQFSSYGLSGAFNTGTVPLLTS